MDGPRPSGGACMLTAAVSNLPLTPPSQAAPKSEMLAEAVPEALKNMVLMLHDKVCVCGGGGGVGCLCMLGSAGAWRAVPLAGRAVDGWA